MYIHIIPKHINVIHIYIYSYLYNIIVYTEYIYIYIHAMCDVYLYIIRYCVNMRICRVNHDDLEREIIPRLA